MIQKLLCKFLGHKWLHSEGYYVGEFNGQVCERCPEEIGHYIKGSKEDEARWAKIEKCAHDFATKYTITFNSSEDLGIIENAVDNLLLKFKNDSSVFSVECEGAVEKKLLEIGKTYSVNNLTASHCACGLPNPHTGRCRPRPAFTCDQKEL